MVTNVATAVWPIYFVLILAFLAGKFGSFQPDAAQQLNKFTLTYALPAMLFISMASLSRSTLIQQLPSLEATAVSYLGMFFLTVGLIYWNFKRTLPEAAIAGVCGASPMAAFFAPAVLPELYGPGAMAAVSVAALVLNILQYPVAFALVGEKASADQLSKKDGTVLAKVFKRTGHIFREPVVFAPILGVIVVLIGAPVPKILAAGFKFIGSTSAGVAVFAVGLLLASSKVRITIEVLVQCGLKMFVLPAVVMGVSLLFGVRGVLLSEAVVTSAFSSVVIATMLASREGIYIEEASSVIVVTSFGLIVSLPLWIYLSKIVTGL